VTERDTSPVVEHTAEQRDQSGLSDPAAAGTPPPQRAPWPPRQRTPAPRTLDDATLVLPPMLFVPAPITVRAPRIPPLAAPGVPYIRTDFLVRNPSKAPTTGWRHLVCVLSGGSVNPGLSAKDKRRAELERRAGTPLRRNHRIAVLGADGVGKTTVAAAVGSTLARLRRGDRVIAVDADTAFGRLGARIDPRAIDSYRELTTDEGLRTFADIRAHVGNNSDGLFVLPGRSGYGDPLDPGTYREAVTRLDRDFAICLVDCPSAIDAPVTREVLKDADTLLVVSSLWVDGVLAAAQKLQFLADNGMTDLLRRTLVIVNDSDGRAATRTSAQIIERFTSHGIGVFQLPFDRRLRRGGVLDISGGMVRRTQWRFLALTAAIADNFGDTTAGQRPQPIAVGGRRRPELDNPAAARTHAP
jgi:MinD-like ATPase involved in chromosome partitioning or flagellar assembly